jgi:LacI family transcriptional regulator
MQGRRGVQTGGTRQRRESVTLEDVAREAGVHYSTVSRALDPNKAWRVNLTTRQHVEKVARRLGYQRDLVASGLKRGSSQTVAVVVADLTNFNVAPVLRGITSRLEPVGLMPLITETQDDPERLQRILSHLLSRRIDALLLTALRLNDGPIVRWIKRQGVPVVLAVQAVPGVRVPTCTYDEFLGGKLAALHLLSLGHRRVAQLRGPDDIYSCLERAEGFSKTIAEAGATEVVLDETAPVGSAEEGHRMMRQLIDRKRGLPTGIFCHHDVMAFGAIGAANEAGLACPDDVSIVGFHDLPHVDLITPPLTSVRLPREELGRTAAEMLLEILTSNDRQPWSRKVAPTLVVRRSTGPARKIR